MREEKKYARREKESCTTHVCISSFHGLDLTVSGLLCSLAYQQIQHLVVRGYEEIPSHLTL